jgi:hypothetical protein
MARSLPLSGVAAVAASAGLALGFDTIGDGFGSKWDDPVHGTAAVVTWSFMTPGVGLGPTPPVAGWSGTNTLGSGDADLDPRAKIDAEFGAGAFDAAVERAFATWAAAADVRFVRVDDSGADLAGSTSPDLRIGAFHFAPGDLAGGAGFGPPGDDLHFPDALAGDLALNDQSRFTVATGPEGSPLPTDQGAYLNDVEGLLLHEIGHTLGLAHSDVVAGVMCGYVFPGDVFDGSLCDYAHVNHELDADDVAGIRAIYGLPAAPVPGPPAWLLGPALLATGMHALARRRRAA